MSLLLLVTLLLASVAVGVSVNTTEEIVKVGAVCTAIICLFVSLICAPFFIKVAVVIALLAIKHQIFKNFTGSMEQHSHS